MHLLLIGEITTANLARAFSWTLIHSLWQGLGLAIIAGLVILRTRKSGSAQRYWMLTGLFGLFLVLVLATFIRELNLSGEPVAELTVLSDNNGIIVHEGSSVSSSITSPVKNDLLSQVVYYFNTHVSLVVLAWLIVFCARCVRMMANLHYIHKIRTQKISSPPDFWKIRIRELATRLMISQPITLLESKLVKVPVMVGLVKPVILFPFALLSQLPADQVEAILLHELAHIRRRDYFVNFLQHIAETVFFFNPGLLWLSSLIRDERENCCDDIAIGQTQSKKQFINALVAFQEYHLSVPRYANAFPGTTNHLLQRVKRILHNDNKTLDMREKLFLVACVAIVGFFTIAYSQSRKQAVVAKKQAPVQKLTDTLPGNKPSDTLPGTGYTVYDKKGFQIVTKADSIVSVQLNGRKMSREQVEEMKPLINDVIDRSRKEADELGAREQLLAISADNLTLQAEKRAAEQGQLQKLLAESTEMQQKLQADKLMAITQDQKRLAEVMRDNSELSNDQAKILLDKLQVDDMAKLELQQKKLELLGRGQDLQKELRELAFQDNLSKLNSTEQWQLQKKLNSIDAEKSMQAQFQKREAELSYELERVMQKQQELANTRIQLDKMNVNTMEQWNRSRTKFIDPILDDLFEGKIISSRDDVSFTLDGQKLVVNGKTQPESLHKKLQDKYLSKPKDKINYSRKGSSESMNINSDK